MDFKQKLNKQENSTFVRTTISNKEAEQFTTAEREELRREQNVEFKTVNDWGHGISQSTADAMIAYRSKDFQARLQDTIATEQSYQRVLEMTNFDNQEMKAGLTRSLTGIDGRELKKRKQKIEQMRAQAAIIVEKQNLLRSLYESLEDAAGDQQRIEAVQCKISMVQFEILEAQYQYNYKYIKAYGKKDAEEAERLAQLALEFAVKKDTLLNNTNTEAFNHVDGNMITPKDKKTFASRRKAVSKELAKAKEAYEKAVNAHTIIKVSASDFEEQDHAFYDELSMEALQISRLELEKRRLIKRFPQRPERDIKDQLETLEFSRKRALRLQDAEKEQLLNAYPLFRERPELLDTVIVGGLLKNVDRKDDGTFANEQAQKIFNQNRTVVATLLGKDINKIKKLFSDMLLEVRRFDLKEHTAYLGSTQQMEKYKDDIVQACGELMNYVEQNKDEEDVLSSFAEVLAELKQSKPIEYEIVKQTVKLHDMRRVSLEEINRLRGYDQKTQTFIEADKAAADQYIASRKEEFKKETETLAQLFKANAEGYKKNVFELNQELVDEYVAIYQRMKNNVSPFENQVPAIKKGTFERDIKYFLNIQDQELSQEDRAANEKLFRAYIDTDTTYIAKVIDHFAEVVLKMPTDLNIIMSKGMTTLVRASGIALMFTKVNNNPEVLKKIDKVKYNAARTKVGLFVKIFSVFGNRMSAFGISSTDGTKLFAASTPEMVDMVENEYLKLIPGDELEIEELVDQLRLEGHMDVADLLTANHTQVPDMKLRSFD